MLPKRTLFCNYFFGREGNRSGIMGALIFFGGGSTKNTWGWNFCPGAVARLRQRNASLSSFMTFFLWNFSFSSSLLWCASVKTIPVWKWAKLNITRKKVCTFLTPEFLRAEKKAEQNLLLVRLGVDDKRRRRCEAARRKKKTAKKGSLYRVEF